MSNQNLAPLQMELKGWALLGALSFLWGASYLFISLGVQELPPFTVVSLRLLLAAIALTLFLYLSGRKLPKSKKIWTTFFTMGFISNLIPFSLITYGQTQVESGQSSILNATTPLFTILVAHIFTHDEKITPRKIAGILLGFAGVAVIIGPDAIKNTDAPLIAQVAILAGSMFYGIASVYARRFKAMQLSPLVAATGQVISAALLTMPLAIMYDRPWTLDMPGNVTLMAIAGLALLSTALAYIVYFKIIEQAGATNVTLVTFLLPPVAIFLGYIFLGEVLAPQIYGGLLLIGLSLYVVNFTPASKRHKPNA